MKKPRPKRHPVRLAEIAIRELQMSISSWTEADKTRFWRIVRGMQWLDNDQANVRQQVAGLVVDFEQFVNGDGDRHVIEEGLDKLLAGLKKLITLSPERLAEVDARESANMSEKRRSEIDALIRMVTFGKG